MTRIVVVLDACVLVPLYLRDFFLRLALHEDEIIEVFWSDKIIEEMLRNLPIKNNVAKSSKAHRIITKMDEFFPDARSDYTKFLEVSKKINLPDPNDSHVVAAAMASKATVIVTNNLKDFPNKKLMPFALKALNPTKFIGEICETHFDSCCSVVSQMSCDYNKPKMNFSEVIEALRISGLEIKTA